MNGLRNCHARGVHSIVLSQQEDRLTRIFLADPDHTLWHNTSATPWRPPGVALSVGYHPHHCDIGIEVVVGRIANLTLRRDGEGRLLRTWRYHSALRGEAPRFELVEGAEFRASASAQSVYVGQRLHLGAETPHTIHLDAGHRAAWIVREFGSDPNYRPLTYSDADLSVFDWTGMYAPLSAEECRYTLHRFGLDELTERSSP